MPDTEQKLDIRTIEPKRKHPAIFETFDSLEPGETFVIINDHNPKPLMYEFEFERNGRYSWEYLEEGPDVWRVRIGKVQ